MIRLLQLYRLACQLLFGLGRGIWILFVRSKINPCGSDNREHTYVVITVRAKEVAEGDEHVGVSYFII